MINNTETRKNGVVITKKIHNGFPMYHVDGSENGPWDYLRNARKDADRLTDERYDYEVVNV